MGKRAVGIKKHRVFISILLWALFIVVTLICLLDWWYYASQDRFKYLNENVIEAEATIVSYHYDSASSSDHTYNWITVYEYKSEWGTVYRGRYALYTRESWAKATIGKKIKIYVDPNSDWSDDIFPTYNYEQAFKRAVISCFPVPIVLYLWIYRCIYRNAINKKILKKYYGICYRNDLRYSRQYGPIDLNNTIMFTPPTDMVKTGEVTKVWRWIVCYVKVKYQDVRGKTKEKWARAWFTHKEAKFLKQKKFINIIPYKKTYGIFEEMPLYKETTKV
ncbi:MAG: DUF3592 domain-containing protein [Clostridiales bacterium]|nr:DUF3592 domain-containing protein [Clostridiales bacterium]